MDGCSQRQGMYSLYTADKGWGGFDQTIRTDWLENYYSILNFGCVSHQILSGINGDWRGIANSNFFF